MTISSGRSPCSENALIEMTTAPEQFRHSHTVRIRFHHVDSLGVVHQNWYFFFFEEARTEYLRHIGFPMGPDAFAGMNKMLVVRNSCDYLNPARFDGELEIFTRVSRVKRSSVTFEQLAVDRLSRLPVARAEHTIVSVDPASNRPWRVPEAIRDVILRFEQGNADFSES